MASFGHLAIGMAAGRAFCERGASKKQLLGAMAGFAAFSMWPDLDFAGMVAGIPYDHPLGHRGATHSLVVALAVGAASLLVARRKSWNVKRTVVLATLVGLTHGLLDSMTYGGGLGCALLWPLTAERLWLPWRFIPVAPLGMGMLSERGLFTVFAELLLFSPFIIYATLPRKRRV